MKLINNQGYYSLRTFSMSCFGLFFRIESSSKIQGVAAFDCRSSPT